MTEILMSTLRAWLPEARGLLSSMLISELVCLESPMELLAKLQHLAKCGNHRYTIGDTNGLLRTLHSYSFEF